MQSEVCGDFLEALTDRRELAGLSCSRLVSEAGQLSLWRLFGLLSLAPKKTFPETKTFGGGDTVRILHPECQATACNRQKPRDFGADMLFMRE